MADINIPEEARRGLLAIHQLNKKQTQSLAKAFKNEKPSLRIGAAQERLKAIVTGIDEERLDDILYAVIGLYLSASSIKGDISQLVEEIVSSEDLSLSPEEQTSLKERLALLLTSESFELTVKATGVQTDYEHVFTSVRAVTEIRPIFQKNPSALPKAAVIAHSLKFTYRKNDTNHKFFVALDQADLKELKRVIERALHKEDSIKSLLKNTAVDCLDG